MHSARFGALEVEEIYGLAHLVTRWLRCWKFSTPAARQRMRERVVSSMQGMQGERANNTVSGMPARPSSEATTRHQTPLDSWNRGRGGVLKTPKPLPAGPWYPRKGCLPSLQPSSTPPDPFYSSNP